VDTPHLAGTIFPVLADAPKALSLNLKPVLSQNHGGDGKVAGSNKLFAE